MSNRVRLVAELSANHGQSLDVALATVRAAHSAGADAIKLQTYTADTITIDFDGPDFRISQGTIWDGTTLHKLYQRAHTPWEWHEPLRDEARRLGLEFFSTPFDPTAVEFLEGLGVPLYKIASFEINDIPLIELVASKGKPMVLSTGVASLGDIEEAVAACRRNGCSDITLLKCTSAYPAPLDQTNLRTIPDLATRFGVRAGLSDHTTGFVAAVGATALGATMIEKHFILDRSVGGPDASFSATPDEFRALATMVRSMELAVGEAVYDTTEASHASIHFRRSLFAVEDIAAGDVLTTANIRSIRPSTGAPPRLLPSLLGRRAIRPIPRGTPLNAEILSERVEPGALP